MKRDHFQSVSSVVSLFKFATVCAAVLLPVQSTLAITRFVTRDTTITTNFSGQLQIVSPNITLNLNGKSIDAGGANWAIYTNQNNVKIISTGSAIVGNANYGIILDNCTGTTISRVNTGAVIKGVLMTTCTNCKVSYGSHKGAQYYGVAIEGGAGNTAEYCKGYGAMAGFIQATGTRISFLYCSVDGGKYGYYVNSPFFVLNGCTAKNNSEFGFELLWSSQGQLKNCIANTCKIGFNNCEAGCSFTTNPSGLSASGNRVANYVGIPCYDIPCR